MRIASKKQAAGAIMLGITIAALACVKEYNPACDTPLSNQACPDGQSSGGTASCTTTDTKTLNEDIGSQSGKTTESSSGKCIYSCTYVNGGTTINCGSKTNNWTGTKPSSTACP